MAAKIDGAGGSQRDGTYYGSTTTSSTPRTPVKKPSKKNPFPGEAFDWDAAQSGEPYQAPRAPAPPRLRIMPDGSVVDENSPLFYRASAAATQANWDYQRAVTERFLRFRGITGETAVPAGGATQPPVVQPSPTGNNGATGTGTFSPDPSAAAGGVAPSAYEYRSWTELREEERELFDTMADLFKAEYGYSSTGTSWYDQLVADAEKIRDRTGIAPDPANLAIQYANKRGYDLKPWLEKVPTLSPNSVLFERGSIARGGEVVVEEDGTDSSGGYRSYGGGGGGYGGGGGGGGGSVSLTNPSSARGLLLQTMQGVLGRNPTEREYKDFINTLKQTEMANPTTVDFEGDLAVQSGGTDPGMLAMEFAQAAEDYKSTQANKFYNAFMGALGGGSDG